jgi:hypothetical protein
MHQQQDADANDRRPYRKAAIFAVLSAAVVVVPVLTYGFLLNRIEERTIVGPWSISVPFAGPLHFAAKERTVFFSGICWEASPANVLYEDTEREVAAIAVFFVVASAVFGALTRLSVSHTFSTSVLMFFLYTLSGLVLATAIPKLLAASDHYSASGDFRMLLKLSLIVLPLSICANFIGGYAREFLKNARKVKQLGCGRVHE